MAIPGGTRGPEKNKNVLLIDVQALLLYRWSLNILDPGLWHGDPLEVQKYFYEDIFIILLNWALFEK